MSWSAKDNSQGAWSMWFTRFMKSLMRCWVCDKHLWLDESWRDQFSHQEGISWANTNKGKAPMKIVRVAFWLSQEIQDAPWNLLYHLQIDRPVHSKDGMQTNRSSQDVTRMPSYCNEVWRDLPSISKEHNMSSFMRPRILLTRHRQVGIQHSQVTRFPCHIPNAL